MTKYKYFVSAAVATVFALLAFGAEPAAAESCGTAKANPDLCGPIAPEGHKFKGDKKMKLTNQVTLCHPQWDNLARKWYSYAIFTDGQLSQLVKSLRRTGSWNQEVELPEGQRCHERSYGENWMFAVFDPCVVEGYNVLRIGRPTPGGTLDSFEEWPIVTDKDGNPILFGI